MISKSCAGIIKHNFKKLSILTALTLSIIVTGPVAYASEVATESAVAPTGTEVVSTQTNEVVTVNTETVKTEVTTTVETDVDDDSDDADRKSRAKSDDNKKSDRDDREDRDNDDKKLDKRYYEKSIDYDYTDLKLLSSIMYCEAGIEGYQGQLAVGIVVMNRVKSDLFPDSIKGVVYQGGQFTPSFNGSLSRRLSTYEKGKNSESMLKSCIKAAKAILDGRRFIVVKKQKVQFKKYLFFSRYISGATYTYKHHDFK